VINVWRKGSPIGTPQRLYSAVPGDFVPRRFP
jgi:hypothetical protein